MSENLNVEIIEKRKNKGNVPNLRFPGFEGEWENLLLGDALDFKVTNSFSRDNLNYNSGEVRNVHYGDIHTKFHTLFDLAHEKVPFINEDISITRISEDFYCKEGDIIIADASEDLDDVGKSIEVVNLNNEKLLAGLHTLLARPRTNLFQQGFLGYLFTSPNVRSQIKKEAQGTKVLSISSSRISKTILLFPSILEQQKISEFIASIDLRIQTQSKIIEEIKSLKDAFTKKIFNREIKFKDNNGDEFPDWQLKKLGDVTVFVNKRNKDDLKLPVYSINNKIGFVPQGDQFNGVDSNVRGYDIKIYKIIGKKTFAYNPARINVGSIGYSYDLENILISSLYVCFQTIEAVDDNFLFQFLKMDLFKKQVLENMEGGVRSYLFYENLSRINILLPCLQEQRKIAELLISLDKKTNIEIEMLQKLKQEKEYLLDNLFI